MPAGLSFSCLQDPKGFRCQNACWLSKPICLLDVYLTRKTFRVSEFRQFAQWPYSQSSYLHLRLSAAFLLAIRVLCGEALRHSSHAS